MIVPTRNKSQSVFALPIEEAGLSTRRRLENPSSNTTDRRPDASQRRIRILRIINRITETSAPYNQFSLPLVDQHQITLCTYYPSPLRPTKLDLFEGDGTWPGFFFALEAALRHGTFDLIHIHSPFVALLFLAARVRRRTALPAIVLTIHNTLRNFKLRNRFFLLPALTSCHKIVCCGQSSYRSLPRCYRWAAGRRLAIIQNGVNLSRIDAVIGAQQPNASTQCFTVACVGRLEAIKNPQTVLRGFSNSPIPQRRLLFIGDGEMRDLLENEAHSLNCAHEVFFSGVISREQVYSALATADLFVSASRGEGLPVAALEAMACRCPVILSDIPPHREIAEGLNCIPLLPLDDTAAWTKAINRYRLMPIDERTQIGEKCRQHVQARFSLATMHQQYEALFRSLLDHSPRKPISNLPDRNAA